MDGDRGELPALELAVGEELPVASSVRGLKDSGSLKGDGAEHDLIVVGMNDQGVIAIAEKIEAGHLAGQRHPSRRTDVLPDPTVVAADEDRGRVGRVGRGRLDAP